MELSPVVFAEGKEYQIAAAVKAPCMMWVQVGSEMYYDEDNGILRSEAGVRRVSVPADYLNQERRYTVHLKKVRERKAYFTETEETESEEFVFCPVKKETVRAFHIADVHNHDEAAIRAAKAFGKMDFLILNGDIPNHCDDLDNIFSIYRIAGEITHGNIPVVFSRGNHDMRGKYAEYFSSYVSTCEGRFYYTFRLGDIWGMVLDCGEDKEDIHAEYGSTICCSAFREKETAFIRQVIAKADQEYQALGIRHRVVLSHIPFTKRFQGEFDIAGEVYSEWTRLLRDEIKPDFILCAHEHMLQVYEPGCEEDTYGQGCPVIVGSEVSSASKKLPENYFAGTGITWNLDEISFEFINSDGEIRKTYCMKK